MYPGDWTGFKEFNYSFINPGDFLIQFKVSNAISSEQFTQNIRIISSVEDMQCNLRQNPVVYGVESGLAQFYFQYTNAATKSGKVKRKRKCF